MSKATAEAAACESVCLRHSEIPHATRLFTDYLYHFDRVAAFYPHAPLDLSSFHRAAASLDYSASVRREVCAVLDEQAAGSGLAAAEFAPVAHNIERLRRGAFALVTGQQVGLFSGPIFTFYKALTAIKLARTLTDQGLDTVPVFWLATEDHDLEEVNHAFLLDRDYRVEMLRDGAQPPVPHAPVGEVRFSAEIDGLVARAAEVLPEGEPGFDTGALLRESYRSGETFGVSFARFISKVFARFGVVVLDPMHARLRALATPVFRKALESAADLHHALDARNQELSRRGYHAQVHVTESTSLLFVRVAGQRTPLRRRDGEFLLNDEPVALAALLGGLDRDPSQFSPNVLLRPVVQDALLPTIGYVGGPAEVAYFAQAGVVYDRILGRMPVIAPRASFTLVDQRAAKLLRRYGLTVPDLFREQHLRERMALRFLPPDLDATITRSEEQLTALLAALRRELDRLDHTLDDAAARAGRKMTYQLGRLKEKAARATHRRNQQIERDAAVLENLLHPRRSLQERVLTGVSFLARYGPDLLDRLYDCVHLECPDHQVVVL